MDIKAIFFDAGNTLLELDYELLRTILLSEEIDVPIQVIQDAEYQSRIAIDEHILKQDEGNLLKPYVTNILKCITPDYQFILPAFMEKLIHEQKQNHLFTMVHPSTYEVLQKLQDRGYALGIISNADGRLMDLLNRRDLVKYFLFILDSKEVGYEKPDSRIFELALGKVNIPSDQIVYIGDIYEIDVIGAKRVGMIPMLMDPGGYYQDKNCIKIQNLLDILNILEKQVP